jgi:peptidyl-prolyl cis-trans isomerase C
MHAFPSRLTAIALIIGTSVHAAPPAFAEENLVTWGDGELTTLDYEAALAAAPTTVRKDIVGNMSAITRLLEGVLVNRTLSREARAMGLDQNPVTAREMQLAAERILALRRLQALEQSLVLPDFTQAAMERYKARPQDFEVKERVRASHILIGAKGRSDEEARARAEEVRRRAVAGEPFDQLAAEYSDDTSVVRNRGDLGLFTRGMMVKPFEEAAFALEKPGQISDVVRSKFGYHVIRLEERKPARVRPFEEVKDEVTAQLRQEYVTTRKQEHVSAIRNDKSIKINEEALKRLVNAGPKAEVATDKAAGN